VVSEAAEETVEQRITQIHKAQAKRFEEKMQQIIKSGDDKAEPNRWLQRVGWAQHLQGLNKAKLRGLIKAVGRRRQRCSGCVRVWNGL
jgi:O-methyltransferase involved in polyketide biosynthesis